MEEKETFRYTYSPKSYEEVRKIREKYLPKQEDKIEQLKKLDASATTKGTIISIGIGIVGTLIFGTGMCCVLMWKGNVFVIGIVVGVVGIAMMGFAYPIYQQIIKKERARIAPEILRLTDEIMKPN